MAAAKRIQTILPASCFVAGVLCLAVSLLWPGMFPASLYWQDQHEDRLERANQSVHNTVYHVRQAEQLGKPLDPQLRDAYDRAKREGEHLRRQAEAARQRPYRIAGRWRWSGIGVLAVGLVAWFFSRNGDA